MSAKDTSSVLDRVRAYDPPPERFNPHTASARELRRYGLPERPDPDREPELARLWRRAFSRPVTFIKPELRARPAFQRRPSASGEVEFAGTGWSGVVVNNGNLGYPGENFNWASGRFMVPEVLGLNPAGKDITVGFWVGIDGDTDRQVLQAGVRADVSGGFFGGDVSYSAWTEWIDEAHLGEPQDGAITVENFRVEPGEWISVLICVAAARDEAVVLLENLSWGDMAVIPLRADLGVKAHGSSAEWIVEGISEALPDFTEIVFMDCICGTQSHVFDLSPGHTRDARAVPPPSQQFGEPITGTTILTPHIATVQWEHFN